MVRILRWFGWILLLGALASLALDVIASLESGSFALRLMGDLLANLSLPALNQAQAFIQRNIHPALWEDVIDPILHWPTVVALGVPGLLLVMLLRPRRR